MELYAIKDRLLVKRVENKASSGLIVPEEGNLIKGIIISVGEETDYVESGNKIYFNKSAAQELGTSDDKCFVLQEKDVLAIIEE
jgi:co-chaperonin GroES (HSP10)